MLLAGYDLDATEKSIIFLSLLKTQVNVFDLSTYAISQQVYCFFKRLEPLGQRKPQG